MEKTPPMLLSSSANWQSINLFVWRHLHRTKSRPCQYRLTQCVRWMDKPTLHKNQHHLIKNKSVPIWESLIVGNYLPVDAVGILTSVPAEVTDLSPFTNGMSLPFCAFFKNISIFDNCPFKQSFSDKIGHKSICNLFMQKVFRHRPLTVAIPSCYRLSVGGRTRSFRSFFMPVGNVSPFLILQRTAIWTSIVLIITLWNGKDSRVRTRRVKDRPVKERNH